MAVKHLFLALLSHQGMHGYELKNAFELLAAEQWPLNFGQVYQTLSRLERDGFIESREVIQEEKPDKKVYYITDLGIDHLKEWLQDDDPWNLFHDEFSLRLMASHLFGPDTVLDTLKRHRSFILLVIKSLTKMRETELDPCSPNALLLERNMMRAEADLKWVTSMIERCGKND